MYELADFRALIIEEKKTKTFDELEREYGGNRWHFSQLLNDSSFVPSPDICRVWNILYNKLAPVCTNPACEGYGEPHVYDCRTQTVKAKREPREKKQRDKYDRFYAWMFEETPAKDWR